jgi:mRNA interferase RelE/StbE
MLSAKDNCRDPSPARKHGGLRMTDHSRFGIQVKPESLTGPFPGLLKLRIGDYRVVYQADREKKVLRVRLVGHRREIYDQLL